MWEDNKGRNLKESKGLIFKQSYWRWRDSKMYVIEITYLAFAMMGAERKIV